MTWRWYFDWCSCCSHLSRFSDLQRRLSHGISFPHLKPEVVHWALTSLNLLRHFPRLLNLHGPSEVIHQETMLESEGLTSRHKHECTETVTWNTSAISLYTRDYQTSVLCVTLYCSIRDIRRDMRAKYDVEIQVWCVCYGYSSIFWSCLFFFGELEIGESKIIQIEERKLCKHEEKTKRKQTSILRCW